MEPLIRTISAWDGLPLRVRIWDGRDRVSSGASSRGGSSRGGSSSGAWSREASSSGAPPVLCLPGLVRTSGDFDVVAPLWADHGRVVSLDYAGRGGSGRSSDIGRYSPEACVRDVLDTCAALHLRRVTIVGTSFGGLLAMGLATARPAMVLGVVLNDVGPEIGPAGADFVREFVARDPALESLDACVTFLKQHLPPLSLATDDDWAAMAALTYARGEDGRFHPVWDTAIARLMNRPVPDLWPLFGALADIPVMLVRGALSNLLLPETVAAMRARKPDMTVVTVEGVGHAPILTEDAVRDSVAGFLKRRDCQRRDCQQRD
jgi:pimeloyl-ACP methyl ester carboxylesterase